MSDIPSWTLTVAVVPETVWSAATSSDPFRVAAAGSPVMVVDDMPLS